MNTSTRQKSRCVACGSHPRVPHHSHTTREQPLSTTGRTLRRTGMADVRTPSTRTAELPQRGVFVADRRRLADAHGAGLAQSRLDCIDGPARQDRFGCSEAWSQEGGGNKRYEEQILVINLVRPSVRSVCKATMRCSSLPTRAIQVQSTEL